MPQGFFRMTPASASMLCPHPDAQSVACSVAGRVWSVLRFCLQRGRPQSSCVSKNTTFPFSRQGCRFLSTCRVVAFVAMALTRVPLRAGIIGICEKVIFQAPKQW
ncbi:hypothetical protein ACMZ6R_06285 [Solidesulfovibrio sp. C21]